MATTDGIDADVAQVISLASSFADMGKALPREIRDSVKRAGQNVKDDTRENVSDHPRWKHLRSTVNYDFAGTGSTSSATIGYDKRGQGNFGHLVEYGGDNFPPRPALIPAFESEAHRFPEFMASIAEKVAREAL